MLLLVIACMVGLCHFGPFESAVHAQNAGSSMTIQSITNETSQQQLKELVDKLSSDFQMQGREYEKQLRSAQNYTKVLSDRLDQYQKDIKELDDKSPCNAKQLLNLDSKLNMTLSQRKIAFFAQRKSPYSTVGRIPFPINPLNEGNGFNSKTGEFAAPVDGIYHFYFSGLKTKEETSKTERLTVQLSRKVSPNRPTTLAEGHVNSQDKYGWFPVQMQATTQLKKGEVVQVELVEGSLHEIGDTDHILTGFGGFLVDLIIE